jgi:hypothetical protein
MKREVLSFVFAGLIGCSGLAQQASIVRADGRQLTVAAIDSMVRKLMDTAKVTGLCLGIVQHN